MDCLECIVHVVGMILQEAANPDTGEDAFQNIKPKICEHCDALVVAGTIELHGQSWRQISSSSYTVLIIMVKHSQV